MIYDTPIKGSKLKISYARRKTLYVPSPLHQRGGIIIGTHEGVYLPISKLHLILAVTNLLAHNNIANHSYHEQKIRYG